MRTQLGVVLASVLLLAGCKSAHADVVKEITVADLQAMQQQGAVKIYDANNDDFRAENGKIPGAVLLASSTKYDLALLPASKDDKIAFYCSSRL